MLDKHGKPFEYYVRKFAMEEVAEELIPMIQAPDIDEDIISRKNCLLRNLKSDMYTRSIRYNIVRRYETN